MTVFTKSSSVNGKWVDKKTLVTGDIIKIVSEASEQPNNQGDGVQLVAKVLVKGKSKEPENFSINAQSKNALIDAYGQDSKDWVEKTVNVHIERIFIGGKRAIMALLVPEGMVLKEGADGYIHIGKPEETKVTGPRSTDEIYPDDENAKDLGDIPF